MQPSVPLRGDPLPFDCGGFLASATLLGSEGVISPSIRRTLPLDSADVPRQKNYLTCREDGPTAICSN
jgi:hypothetical protein